MPSETELTYLPSGFRYLAHQLVRKSNAWIQTIQSSNSHKSRLILGTKWAYYFLFLLLLPFHYSSSCDCCKLICNDFLLDTDIPQAYAPWSSRSCLKTSPIFSKFKVHCCKYFLPDICNIVMNSLSCMFCSSPFAIMILPKSFYAVCLSCVYLTRAVLILFLVSLKYWNPSFFPMVIEGQRIIISWTTMKNRVNWLQNHFKRLKFDLCEHHL